jgi:predicted nuclease with TOPRIM domain
MKEFDFVKFTIVACGVLIVACLGGWVFFGLKLKQSGREVEDVKRWLERTGQLAGEIDSLEDEKRKALKNMAPAHSSKLRKINDDFKRIERNWNSLTEDLINLDEGIFFLERNLDYLKSARTFLISAKGSFDIESWVSSGYLSDLFRHSNIGRAKEMADGADRNLQMAQKELVCVSSLKIHPEQIQRVLVPILEALFEDIFKDGRIQSSLQVMEAALSNNLKQVEQIKAKRAILDEKLQEAEKLRNQIFSQLGADRAGRLVG